MFDVIPRVNALHQYGGDVNFDGGIRLAFCEEAAPAARSFRNVVLHCCPSVAFTPDGKVSVSFEKDALLPPEGYVIDANGDSLTIKAAAPAGWTYAVCTIRQLLKPDRTERTMYVTFPCCRIEDSPRFTYRGFMLDEARNFFGETEVKRLLDLMCLYKLNVLHWHLSDDQGYRVESEAFPLLNEKSSRRNDTQVGGTRSDKFTGLETSGMYTKNQIRQIVAYAAERNITVVPELDIPGHTSAILAAYPKLSCSGEKTDVPTTFGRLGRSVCPGHEENYAFLERLIDEWCELFPSKFFHIGADEVAVAAWKNCPACAEAVRANGLRNESELLTLFINRISEMLLSRGKFPIVWGDKLRRGLNRAVSYEAWMPLPKAEVDAQISAGRKFVVAPYDFYYASNPYCIMPLKKTYKFEPTSIRRKKSGDAGIVGVEMPLWTEWVYDRRKIDFNLFPRLCALAETAWTAPSLKSYSDFRTRWSAHKKLLDDFEVGYAKDKLTDPGIVARRKGAFIWKTADQYDEVRKNDL